MPGATSARGEVVPDLKTTSADGCVGTGRRGCPGAGDAGRQGAEVLPRTQLVGPAHAQGHALAASDGEGPVRTVELASFLIDPTCVTNKQFGTFVKATGYQTDAERFGWSFVFRGLVAPGARAHVIGFEKAVRQVV